MPCFLLTPLLDSIEIDPGSPGVLGITPTPTTTQTVVPGLTSSQRASNIGEIIGSVIGGVITFAAAFIVFLLMKSRRKHQQDFPTAAEFDPTPQPVMDGFRPQSDGAEFVPPSLPETHAPPMRIYVRVSMSRPLSQICACSHVTPLFHMHRTRTIHPRSPGTKKLIPCQIPTPRFPQRPTLETP
jgi:hypothetical protein